MQFNVSMSEDTKTKLEWLTETLDETGAGFIRRAIHEAYEVEKAKHQNDVEFVRWIRSQRQA